jgi:tetratricopeptide (TPR) repeat protein
MNFISVKCPECGGAMSSNSEQQLFKCKYCDADIMLHRDEDANTENTKGLAQLAEAAEKAGNHQEAFSYYTKILEKNPSDSAAWVGKGTSAAWQSSLAKHRLNEMLSYYDNAIDSAGSEELKAVVKADCAVRALLVCRAVFEMSVDHVMDFISVDSAKWEHIDRCKAIVTVCEKAHEYDPDLKEISDLIVDVCGRIVKLSSTSTEEKKFFEDAKGRHFHNTSPSQISVVEKTYGCFVVTATVGSESSNVLPLMRKFRDDVLAKSNAGRSFNSWCYKKGPFFADAIRDSVVKRAFSLVLIVLPAALCVQIYFVVASIFQKWRKTE